MNLKTIKYSLKNFITSSLGLVYFSTIVILARIF